MRFFYRFDGLDLVPGNKTAGFDFVLDTRALVAASREPRLTPQSEDLRGRLDAKLKHAKLARRGDARHLGILFHADSWAPRAFCEDAVFGGSLGADPETFGHLEKEDVLAWLGEEVRFTPHNVDAPAQALRLVLMAQTWAEAFRLHCGHRLG